VGSFPVIVLDTHAFIWWVTESAELSSAARDHLATEDTVSVPSICLWEVAMLAAKSRIDLGDEVEAFLRDAIGWRGVRVHEITPAIATRAGGLPATFPGDPADRLIVATALDLECQLVTRDARIIDAGLVEVLRA
jgi:PIN domain nuclease of toxin-antitoxin system